MTEENQYGAISLKNFYIRRFFRIFPAYYFILLVYFVLQLFHILYFTRTSWLSSIFYYKYLVEPDNESRHFWSLSVEEHFYLVWPVLFWLSKRTRVYFAFGIIFLVFADRLCGYYKYFHNPLLNDWAFIFQRVDAIMIGCLCALYQERIVTWINTLVRRKLLLPLVLLVFVVNSPYFLVWNQQYRLHLGFLLIPLSMGTPISTLGNCLIGILVLFSISRKNGWSTFLNLRFMKYIGKLSYSLYLWQQMFIFSDKIGFLTKFPLNLLCIAVTTLFSYYVIEQPFLRLRSKLKLGNRLPNEAGPGMGGVNYAIADSK